MDEDEDGSEDDAEDDREVFPLLLEEKGERRGDDDDDDDDMDMNLVVVVVKPDDWDGRSPPPRVMRSVAVVMRVMVGCLVAIQYASMK